MKNIHKYIMLFVMAFAVASCADDEIIENKNLGKSGDEVQFGLSLDNGSRTVYGEEADNAFPIYWVNGDKVQIFSPQCLEGRRNAEYEVILPTELPEGKLGPDYADNLEKTGSYGVQWGAETADFYSLYPSGNYTLSADGTKAENVVINYSQNIQVSTVNGEEVIKSDMEDCLMYAKTENVAVGETVNLQYNPISTVIYFTLKVEEKTGGTADNYTIQSISLIAPSETKIAGTFSLNVKDGTFGGFVTNASSNTVQAQISDVATGGFYTLTNGESLSLPLFLAPDSNLKSVAGWKVQVVANGKTYTKTLGEKELVAGKIHKITLPELEAKSIEWSVANWMKNIPRNVYLSEVSIPGSWDSINSDKQGETDIAIQYSYGVRAFHFDTRWRTSATSSLFGYTSGSINALSVAGAATSSKYDNANSNNNRVVLGGGETFEQKLDKIIEYLSDDEYMVLVCTFAQDSYDYSGTNGKWYSEISAICAKDKYANTLVDAKTISPNTVVGDVLGRLLVIVNMPISITTDTALPDNSRCLFTYLPTMLDADHFDGTDDNQDKFWLSYKEDDTAKAKDSGIIVYNTQAQVTANGETPYDTGTNNRGYAPTIAQRQAIGNKILGWSKNNYNKTGYAHDMWIYLGLGGYYVSNTSASEVKGSASTVAGKLNPWISGKIDEMGTIPTGQTAKVPYYPVGIVLMNYVDTYASTVEKILLLNNKYRLQFDSTKPVDYNDPNFGDVTSPEEGDGV